MLAAMRSLTVLVAGHLVGRRTRGGLRGTHEPDAELPGWASHYAESAGPGRRPTMLEQGSDLPLRTLQTERAEPDSSRGPLHYE